MTLHVTIPAWILAGALLGGVASAQTPNPSHHLHADETAALGLEDDPFAPVYIVTSRDTYRNGLQAIARDVVDRRDSVGNALVVARIKANQLTGVSHLVHTREKRCGGYFAFATRAEADAFIAADRSALARRTVFLAHYTIDNQATVGPWLSQVQEANIRDTIDHLSTAWPNRYYASTHGQNAAQWIRDTWLAMANGRSDVTAELFTGCSNCSTQPSVILTIEGTELPDEIVVLGGHLDSISSSGSGDNMDAPGADDDASGIATLTEVIRVALASGWQPKRTVKFMGYAAEEVGLRGSNAIAQSFQGQGRNVVGVLQLDMTNYAAGASVDMQLITDYSNAGLQQFVRDVFDEYLAPTGLTRGTYTCGYGCSDHASWTSAGYPSAMMFEASFNNEIHTPGDTLSNMGGSASPSVPLAQLGLGFLGELAKTAGGGSDENAPPVANFTASPNGLTVAFTDTSSDSDGSIVSRSWNFGDGGSSTATNPGHAYATAGTYNVRLTVTDNDGASNSKTLPVTVNDGGGSGGSLEDGVPVTGISGTSGSEKFWTLVVPTGASNLSFTMSGGSGDADLYVKAGSAPTDSSYDCRPYKSGNNESCTIAAPVAGTYHVRIKGYSAFSGVSLVGDYSTGDGGGGSQTYSNATDYAISDYTTVSSPIAVSGRTGKAPSSTQVKVDIKHTYTGDLKVDLVAPDGSVYVLSNRAGGSTDNIVKTYTVNLSGEDINGNWKLRVKDSGSGDTGKIDSWSITF